MAFTLDRQDAADLLNAIGHTDRRNGGKKFRADAADTAVFLRQLTTVLTRTYDRKYPELKARKFIPVNTSVDTGSESFVWRSFDIAGMAKIISNFADDLPMVDVIAGEQPQLIKSLGDGFQYSLQDIRNSLMAGTQLDTKRGFAVRRVMENTVEVLAAVGNAAAGLPGFVNNANVPIISAPGSITGDWTTATAQEMYDDLNAMANAMVVSTSEVFTPDTIILSTNRFSIVATKAMSAIDSTTVLKRFLENSPYIRNVDQWAFLNTADAAGTGPRAIVYKRDPEIVELFIPQEFEQLAPQARNLSFVVNCHMRIGGVTWYYPLGGQYVDGL